MTTLLVAVFAAVGFSGAALFALLGRGASPALQSYVPLFTGVRGRGILGRS